MLPAPGQIERALGFRADGLDDLAVSAEVLDAPDHLDVHQARLVTDRSPSVDGARGLVHVVTGSNPLASAKDLTAASEIKGMDLARMAVQRNGGAWLEPPTAATTGGAVVTSDADDIRHLLRTLGARVGMARVARRAGALRP
jgi:hypothetical protein